MTVCISVCVRLCPSGLNVTVCISVCQAVSWWSKCDCMYLCMFQAVRL